MFIVLVGNIIFTDLYARMSDHPRLILTPERIETLKISINSTHRDLWEKTQHLADNFYSEPIPLMKNAHNRYRRLGDTMPVLGLVFLITEDRKYTQTAIKWIEALLEVPSWSGSQNLGRSAWMVGCALLYDWLYHDLDSDLRDRIKDRLLREAPIVIKTASDHRALSNHLLIETTALGMVGLALQNESEMSQTFTDHADQWAEYIIDHAPRDGSWGEGIQYWQYGLGYFLRYLEATQSSGYKNYYESYHWLQKTGFFPIHFSLPERSNQVVNFSDCGSRRYLPAFLLYLPASIYNNGYFQDFGNRLLTSESHKFSWLDFMFYNPTIEPKNIHELPTLRHFSDNDFVIMRSDWERNATTIGFRCGPAPGHRNQNDPNREKMHGFGPGHGHPDINSFCLFANGEWLAIDPGYTKLKETHNHNTLIVNGVGQAGEGDKWLDYMAFEARQPAPAILRVESNPVYDYVLGDAGNIYKDEARLKSFKRHFLFLKPDIVVIADDLQSDGKSRFEWLLNAQDSIATLESNSYELVQDNVRLWIQPLAPDCIHARVYNRKISISGVRDESNLARGIITTLNLSVETGGSTLYLVVLAVLKDRYDKPPKINFDNTSLQIITEDQKWIVRISEPNRLADKTESLFKIEYPEFEAIPYYNFIRN